MYLVANAATLPIRCVLHQKHCTTGASELFWSYRCTAGTQVHDNRYANMIYMNKGIAKASRERCRQVEILHSRHFQTLKQQCITSPKIKYLRNCKWCFKVQKTIQMTEKTMQFHRNCTVRPTPNESAWRFASHYFSFDMSLEAIFCVKTQTSMPYYKFILCYYPLILFSNCIWKECWKLADFALVRCWTCKWTLLYNT